MPRPNNPFTKIPNKALEKIYRDDSLPGWIRLQFFLFRHIEGYHKDCFNFKKYKEIYEELGISKIRFYRALDKILSQGNYLLDRKRKRIMRLYPKIEFKFRKK